MNRIKIGGLEMFFLVVFWVAIYGMTFLFGMQFEQIYHLHLLVGGFSLWLVVNVFSLRDLTEGHYRKTNWHRNVLSLMGYLACLVLFPMAIILMFPSKNFPPESIATALLWFKIEIMLLVYVIICIIFIWTKYVVKDGTSVTLDGKILYPGQEYRISPFFGHKTSVTKESLIEQN